MLMKLKAFCLRMLEAYFASQVIEVYPGVYVPVNNVDYLP